MGIGRTTDQFAGGFRMKQYIVTLNARSRSLPLAEISRQMGVEPSPGSHAKGDADERGRVCYIASFWRLDSDAGDAATVEDHCRSLRSRLPRGRPPRTAGSGGDLEVCLSVGVMYDTFTASVPLPPALVELAHDLGAGIEVSCYPTRFDETDRCSGLPTSGETDTLLP